MNKYWNLLTEQITQTCFSFHVIVKSYKPGVTLISMLTSCKYKCRSRLSLSDLLITAHKALMLREMVGNVEWFEQSWLMYLSIWTIRNSLKTGSEMSVVNVRLCAAFFKFLLSWDVISVGMAIVAITLPIIAQWLVGQSLSCCSACAEGIHSMLDKYDPAFGNTSLLNRIYFFLHWFPFVNRADNVQERLCQKTECCQERCIQH